MKDLKQQTAFDKFTDQIILAVDSHNGRYSMEHLIESYDFDNASELQEHIDMCKTVDNEENEGYYDSWNYILDNALITHKGITYRLEQNGDIWFVPVDIEVPEDWYI